MSQPPGPVVIAILQALQDLGPMSRADLQKELPEVSPASIGSALSRLGNKQAILPKRIFVKSWTFEADGQRDYWRPVYAPGNKTNEHKPKPDLAASAKLYRDRNRGQVSSVWDLGTPHRSNRALHRLT